MTVTVAPFDVDALRARFPALAVEHDGRPLAFFDGPGGTQVPQSVIDAVSRYYRESNANAGGAFTTSRRSDEVLAEAHRAMADLLGAADPAEIAFGANMTSLTFHFSRSIGATWQPGDEIVVTTLDHDANVSPWRAVAADRGVRVHTVDIDPADCTLDLGALDRVLSSRTRLVAFGWASNALGTINPVADIVARAHGVGAATYVDAVHWVPTVRSTSRPSAPTSSPVRSTSSSVRTRAWSTLARTSASVCPRTRSGRPTTGSRREPRITRRRPGPWQRSSTSPASAGPSAVAPVAGQRSLPRWEPFARTR